MLCMGAQNSSSRGELYRLARAALHGAVIATAWFALASLFILRTFPVPVYYVPIMGAASGAAWHALGRVPLQGRLWYYCRWVLISIVGGFWLIVGGTLSEPATSVGTAAPPGIMDVLATLGMFVLCGIGLAHYAERLKAHNSRPQRQVYIRAGVGLLIRIVALIAIAWQHTR